MTERPILFSGPMVRAILEGRKTQTRRLVGPLGRSGKFPLVNLRSRNSVNYSGRFNDPMSWGWANAEDGAHAPLGAWPEWCPYGAAGDRLWVRETWRKVSHGIVYRADGPRSLGMDEYSDRHRWKPSIFMPRIAGRLVLEVTAVRVERLQDISMADAVAEGVECELTRETLDGKVTKEGPFAPAALMNYGRLWDSLNAKRAPWDSNPWVWVIEFRRIVAAAGFLAGRFTT